MNYVVISCNGSHYVCCDVILFLSLTIIYNYFVKHNLHNKLKHFVKHYEREHIRKIFYHIESIYNIL
ncbi:hypothetical protein PFNF135_00908 [Plasmodium falciparum NF135/5.C10]|uniref:Uncharacterized protein n=1 Tax=Plasmodium falciparum NF135/5.C10 TaxID=1036726 RepID=W4IM07_PLAFA|nr:hypothetical protein PFNF135_00908 [Plasmodium falciparum NF135/5.C10]